MPHYGTTAAIRAFCITVTFLSFFSTEAATVGRSDSAPCNVRVSGPIGRGDAAQLERSLQPNDVVCLVSDGGSYLEGLAMASSINAVGARTLIEGGASCLSACAIAFMAGRKSRFDTTPWRTLSLSGRVGFHAPFLGDGLLEERAYSKGEMLVAYDAAISSLGRLLELSDKIGIPKSLMEEMLHKGRDDMLYVDTIDKAGRWDIQLSGEQIVVAPIMKSLVTACINTFQWSHGSSSIFDYEANFDARSIKFDLTRIGRTLRGVFGYYGNEGAASCSVEGDVIKDGVQEGRVGFATDFGTGSRPADTRTVPSWYFVEPATKLQDLIASTNASARGTADRK